MKQRIRKKRSKKTWAVGLLRLTLVVLAYNHFMLPKQNALPSGTQRTLWLSLKNAWKLARLRYWAATR